jgi:hypothetical protein
MKKSNKKLKKVVRKVVSKSKYKRNREAMQNVVEKLKEMELTFCLSSKLTETQTNLLIRKFVRFVKGESFEVYTKKVIKRDGSYYLVDSAI